MNTDMMGRPKKGLDPKLIPPRGAKATGEVFPVKNGEDRIIYEQKVFDLQETLKTREPVKDAEGKPLVRKNQATGEPLLTVHKITPQYRVRRFILRAFGNGKVKAIENFDLTDEQKKDRENRRARDRWMEEFRDLAMKEGVTPADIVKQFVTSKANEGEELTLDEEEVTELADTLEDELEGVMQRPELPFPITDMSVRDIKQAVSEVELTEAQKVMLREAEAQGQDRQTIKQLLV